MQGHLSISSTKVLLENNILYHSTRAALLRLSEDLNIEEFERALKEFVAQRGRPQMLVSDSGKAIISRSKMIMTQKNSEDLVNYIVNCNIWKYIMSKAPWWGGFLECLVGIMKRTLSNLVGKRFLSYGVQEDVLLDIECMMNNRL